MKTSTKIIAGIVAALAAYVASLSVDSQATNSCASGQHCPTRAIPLHVNVTALTGQGTTGIGTALTQDQFRKAITIAQDHTPDHVDVGWAACGENLNQAMLGLDCIAQHYWNFGTIAQDFYGYAVAKTKLASGIGMGVVPAPVNSLTGIVPNVTLLVDSGGNAETVTVFSIDNTTSPPTFVPSAPGFSHTHLSGVDVVTSPTVQPFTCSDTANTDPYDPRWTWLTNLGPQSPPWPLIDNTTVPTDSAIEHFASTSAGDGSGLIQQTNEAYQPGQNCGTGPATGLEKPKFGINLNSYVAQVAIDSELQGEGYPAIIVDGQTLQATPYPWVSPGTTGGGTARVCNPGGTSPSPCPEPTFHIDVYPLVAADRQYATATCMTGNAGTPGGFIENDPGSTGSTAAPLLPGLDAMHINFYTQIKHNAAEADPKAIWFDGSPLRGRPFYFTANGGSCQDKIQPAYVSSWYKSANNMFMMNDEDSLVDTNTCGGGGTYPTIVEPTRLNATAIFAVNTMTDFIANHARWQFENSCSQPFNGPLVTQAGLGGMDDVSLRYWLIGTAWLVYDPTYTFIRENLIGSNSSDPGGADIYGEEQIVPLDPVSTAQTYATPSPGHTANGGCPTSGVITFSNGEGGGLGSLAASNGTTGTCGATNENGALFQFAPVAARQFLSCYLRGVYLGPCATVVNFRFTANNCSPCTARWVDTSTGWTNTFGTNGAVIPYQHILNLNDAINNSLPCRPTNSGEVGGPGVSPCANDIFENGPAGTPCFSTTTLRSDFNGTCLDVTDYSKQLIVLSGATTQLNTCHQGIGVSTGNGGGGPGSLTVCEAEAVLLFK